MITRRLSLSSINKTAPYQVWTEKRLFSIWFHSYSEKDRFFHEYKELIIDGIGYYMAILSRKDNPLLPDRLAAFESVFKQISAK